MNKLPALLSFLLMTAPPGLMAGEPVYGIGDEVRRIITPQGGGGADVARPESGSPEAAVEFRPPLVGDSIAPAEGDLVFGDGDRTLRLRFDVDTGALDLFHAPGIRADAAARSLDVYATAYRGTSSEKDDQVVRRYDQVDLHGRPVVRFVCANAALGCRVTKEYTVDVDHGELAKRITFAGEERRLIFVESATVVPASFRADGYYRVWMEHIGRQRSSFLSASIANDIAPYPSRLDNTRKQPCVLVLNKVTEDAGYGEAVIEVNGIPMPHYTGVGGKAIGTVANLHRVTILTANGWQIPRGMVEVKADRTQTLKWVYRFYRGNYLNYHQDYHQRYYAPGFAPPSRPEKTNLAFDLGNTTPMVVWDEAAGNLVPSDGYRPADPPPRPGPAGHAALAGNGSVPGGVVPRCLGFVRHDGIELHDTWRSVGRPSLRQLLGGADAAPSRHLEDLVPRVRGHGCALPGEAAADPVLPLRQRGVAHAGLEDGRTRAAPGHRVPVQVLVLHGRRTDGVRLREAGDGATDGAPLPAEHRCRCLSLRRLRFPRQHALQPRRRRSTSVLRREAEAAPRNRGHDSRGRCPVHEQPPRRRLVGYRVHGVLRLGRGQSPGLALRRRPADHPEAPRVGAGLNGAALLYEPGLPVAGHRLQFRPQRQPAVRFAPPQRVAGGAGTGARAVVPAGGETGAHRAAPGGLALPGHRPAGNGGAQPARDRLHAGTQSHRRSGRARVPGGPLPGAR